MANALIDLDGTITDPRTGMIACLRVALDEVGCPIPPDDELASHIGPPLHDTLDKILGPRRAERSRALAAFRRRYESGGMFETSIYPGMAQALADLRTRNVKVIIATSKPTVYSNRIIEHLGLTRLLAAVHGCELDGTRADKVHLIAHILETESLDPSATIMVGDRAQDIRGARANGVASVGALWGYGSRAELEDAGAGVLCQNPSVLVEVLDSRLRGNDGGS